MKQPLLVSINLLIGERGDYDASLPVSY